MDKQIEELYKLFLEYPDVCTDSRKIKRGSLFFALKGPSFDGNKYAQSALDQGASIAIIDDKEYSVKGKTILVKDVLKSLQLLSKYYRSQLQIPIIGITGSNGKTTSKELINCVLSTKYKVGATVGNFNNHIGVPLSLLSIREDHEIGVIEMGTSGHGEIEFLCDLCQPDYGLITSIGKAHLEGLGDLDGVVKEKTALYRSLSNNEGTIVYDGGSKYLRNHLPVNTHNISYNSQGSYAFELELISTFPTIEGVCKRGSEKYKLESKMYGDYNVDNIVAAITIGDLFDVSMPQSIHAINQYLPKNNRSEVLQYKGANIYLDAYNANPSSVELVIKQFEKSKGKKILILGDMLEVGINEELEHAQILRAINKEKFEKVILLGDLYFKNRLDYADFKFFADFDSLKSYFDSLDLNQKNILFKGSRGMGLERLIK